jgi:hypothetical protein
LGLLGAELHGIEVGRDVLNGVQSAEDVAMPEEPLQPLRLGRIVLLM